MARINKRSSLALSMPLSCQDYISRSRTVRLLITSLSYDVGRAGGGLIMTQGFVKIAAFTKQVAKYVKYVATPDFDKQHKS